MSGDIVGAALERIDRAIARIEAVAARLSSLTTDDAGLAARHAALRDEVVSAIAAIDAMIAEEED